MIPFSPADYPDHRGPRPPAPAFDSLDMEYDDMHHRTIAAIRTASSDFARLEQDQRGLDRHRVMDGGA